MYWSEIFFFEQKTAFELRISDWSSDVCSSDLVEAIRTAQEKYGKGKHMTREQVRWGFENLNITKERLEELGFAKLMRPVKTSCSNHMGDDSDRQRVV